MSAISRRTFLKALGIGAAAGAAPWTAVRALGATGELTQPALWGRAFAETPVRDAVGQVVRVLRPDEVTPLRPLHGTVVQLPDGRTDRRHLQPIARPESRWVAPQEAGWVQVAAPYAALRRWCAHTAPLVARPGWGAVLYAETVLHMDAQDWLGLQLGDQTVWSPGAAWRTVDVPAAEIGSVRLELDAHRRRITVFDDERALWSADAAIPAAIVRGEYALLGRSPADSGDQPGAPWALDFGAWRMTGAYWHNSFFDAGYRPPAWRVELPVLAAQALYALPVGVARIT
jgi:hypothetical protein